MQKIFRPGDTKTFTRTVRAEDCAAFESGPVHNVYATFALARDAEWCCRLFVLEMKEEDEEGIGTMLTVEHLAPALAGSVVEFTATVKTLQGHELVCTYEARAGNRLIARGEQGQKVLKKSRLAQLFSGKPSKE
jgi:predicted thioesterase